MISPINQPSLQNAQSAMTQGYASNVIPIRGGREGARTYPVAAGYAALLLDEENKMFFLKTNDSSGIPRQLREFKYEEVTPADPATFDPSNFATKEDFNVLLNEIKKMNNNEGRNRHYEHSRRRNGDGKSYEKSI